MTRVDGPRRSLSDLYYPSRIGNFFQRGCEGVDGVVLSPGPASNRDARRTIRPGVVPRRTDTFTGFAHFSPDAVPLGGGLPSTARGVGREARTRGWKCLSRGHGGVIILLCTRCYVYIVSTTRKIEHRVPRILYSFARAGHDTESFGFP